MKKIGVLILVAVCNVAAVYSQGMLINHACADLTAVPAVWIDSAKTKLKVTYQHTSHGSQLISGINAIASTHGGVYNFTSSGWGIDSTVFLNDYGMPGANDLGHNGDLAWRDATISALNDPECNRNVVMWSWCGGVSDNDSAGIYTYLNAMSALENNFPGVKFIYMTGHLDGSGVTGNLNRMNNLIRNYCAVNNKILFDFADIESYAPGQPQNYMEWCGLDGLNYDSTCNNPWSGPNWGEQWVAQHPSHPYVADIAACTECAHSDAPNQAKLNCILKGNAFWHLMARLAGWNPSTTDIHDDTTRLPEYVSLSQNFPNPFNPSTVIGYQLAVSGKVSLKIYNLQGQVVCTLVEATQNAGYHSVNWDGRNEDGRAVSSGIYIYRLKAGAFTQSRKMMLLR